MDVLPPSLEWLYIEDGDKKYIPILVSQLLDLVSNRETRAPNLDCLGIEGSFYEEVQGYYTSDICLERLCKSLLSSASAITLCGLPFIVSLSESLAV